MEDDDERELIIEEDDIVTADHDTSAQMEYDDVTDSPAISHNDDAEVEENGAKEKQNGGDAGTKLKAPIQEIYPKKVMMTFLNWLLFCLSVSSGYAPYKPLGALNCNFKKRK